MSTLRDELQDVLDLRKPDAFDPDAPFYVVATTWAKEVGDLAQKAAEKVSQTDFGEAREVVKEYVLQFYDDVVVPYDFPKIPNMWESMIEATFRQQIPEIIDGVFDLTEQRLGEAAS